MKEKQLIFIKTNKQDGLKKRKQRTRKKRWRETEREREGQDK